MIFSSWLFLQKTNEQIRLYYLSTCFCSFFGRKWRHLKDISKLTNLYEIPCIRFGRDAGSSNIKYQKKLNKIMHKITNILDVLWGQLIKLIQVFSTSEFHEYWWNDIVFIFFVPSTLCRASEASNIDCVKNWFWKYLTKNLNALLKKRYFGPLIFQQCEFNYKYTTLKFHDPKKFWFSKFYLRQ